MARTIGSKNKVNKAVVLAETHNTIKDELKAVNMQLIEEKLAFSALRKSYRSLEERHIAAKHYTKTHKKMVSERDDLQKELITTQHEEINRLKDEIRKSLSFTKMLLNNSDLD